MSAKKGVDFLSGLKGIAQREEVRRFPERPPEPVAEEKPQERTVVAARQASRAGRVAITQWVDPLVRKQLAQIGLDTDQRQHELLATALNLLFERHGKPPIAKP